MRNMRKWLPIGLLCAVVCMLLVSAAVHADTVYSGYLSSDTGDGSADGYLDGTGFWIDSSILPGGEPDDYTPTEFSWTVSDNADGSWNYAYDLRVYRAEASHWLLETSDAFALGDLITVDGAYTEIVTGTHEGHPGEEIQPNPYMPDDLYGMKMNDTSGTGQTYNDGKSYIYTLTFDTWRQPVWADFYAKCGKVGGTQNTAWNLGFTDPDSDPPYSVAASDGSYNNHVLAPDTKVPEPGTVVLLTLGLGALVWRRRNRCNE